MGRRKVVLGLAAATPLIFAGAAGARFSLDAARARRRGATLDADVPTPEPSLGLAAAFALDTLLTLPMGLLSSTGSAEHYARSSDELDEAVGFYAGAGWLADPASRHRAPTDVPDIANEMQRPRHCGREPKR